MRGITIISKGVNTTIKNEFRVPKSVITIYNLFKLNGFKLYIVGGAVRDVLTNRNPKDFDLVSDARPSEIKDILKDYPTIESGEQFAVVNVVVGNDNYEIATFREDLTAGRNPEVRYSTIDKDVLRRDLTINALYYDIENKSIIDLVGGYEDIKNNIIRTVGNPVDRFNEDKLRILRVIRFASRMGTDLNEYIQNAIFDDNSTISGDGKPLSQERIQDEFVKGFKQAKSKSHFVELVKKMGLFKWVFQNLNTTGNIVETKHLTVMLANILKNNLKVSNSLITNLKFSSVISKEVEFLIHFMDNMEVCNSFKLKKEANRLKINNQILFELCKVNKLDKTFVKIFNRYEITTNGSDLLERGFKGVDLGLEKERIEIGLFNKLYRKHIISYSALVLDEVSREKMINFLYEYGESINLTTVDILEKWNIDCDHFTIKLGILEDNMLSSLGDKFQIIINGINHNDKVITVSVETPLESYNKNKHITLAHNKEKGLPHMSNEFNNFKPLKPFTVFGILKEIPHKVV